MSGDGSASLPEVYVDLGEGAHATGFLLDGGSLVLTGAHCVKGLDAVHVLRSQRHLCGDPRSDVGEPCKGARVVWRGSPNPKNPGEWLADLALVQLASPVQVDNPVKLAFVNRKSYDDLAAKCYCWPTYSGNQPVTIAGRLQPRAREPAEPGHPERLSGQMEFQVTLSQDAGDTWLRELATNESQWAGASGGGVVAQDLNGTFWCVGAVSGNRPDQSRHVIQVDGFDSLAQVSDPDWTSGTEPRPNSQQAFWKLVLGADRWESELKKVRVLPTRSAPGAPLEAPYRETLREIGRDLHARMPQLLGRNQELADIAAFATSDQGYRWLTAGPWTGKSALMYTAVTAGLPDTVDVVSYFMRRVASDADSSKFLGAVVPQLAYLCDQDTPTQQGPDQYLGLWRAAASKAAESGRHLLLVVDGLDEDLSTGAYGSVASLLPTFAGGHAHVHLTSRLHPELPADLTAIANHPLSTTTPLELAGFPGCEHQATLARDQLKDILRRHPGALAYLTLGFLTAAAGPLTTDDLAALTAMPDEASPARRQEIADLLVGGGDLARVVQPTGPPSRPRFQFAHGSLLEQAQAHSDFGDDYYRRKLHDWCATWQHRGWPLTTDPHTTTPRYLLDTYPGMLASDPDRRAALVGDLGWVDTAIREVGVDQVLATLHLAACGLRASSPATGAAGMRAAGTLAATTAPGLSARSDRAGSTSQAGSPAPKGAATGAGALLSTLAAQVSNLRAPEQLRRPGYVLRQIRLQSLQSGYDVLADNAFRHLSIRCAQGLMPVEATVIGQPAVEQIGMHDDVVSCILVRPDGSIVSVGYDGRVRGWDPARPGIPADLGRAPAAQDAVAMLPDGRLVTGGRDGRLLLWEGTPTGSPVVIGTHDPSEGIRTIGGLAAMSSPFVASGGADGRVRVWNLAEASPPFEAGHHAGGVTALAALGDRLIVTGGSDGRVMVWNAAPPANGVQLGFHEYQVLSAHALDEWHVVTGGRDGKLRIWDVRRPKAVEREVQSDSAIHRLSDGRIATGEGRRVQVRDPGRPSSMQDVGNHDDFVTTLAALADGQIVSGGRDGRVQLWRVSDVAAPVPTRSAKLLVGLACVAVLRDGRLVSGGDDGEVLIWDAQLKDAPTPLSVAEPGLPRVDSIVALRDGRVLTTDGPRLLLWDLDAPRFATELGSHWTPGICAAELPDGYVVSGGWDQRVLLWDPDSPGTPEVVTRARVLAISTLLNGQFVTGGQDGCLRLWTLGQSVSTLVLRDPGSADTPGDTSSWVTALATLPDGRIVSGDMSGRVRLWDAANPGSIVEVGHHCGRVRSVITLSGDVAVSAGEDGFIRVWDLNAVGDPFSEAACIGLSLASYPAPGDDPRFVVVHPRGLSIWALGCSLGGDRDVADHVTHSANRPWLGLRAMSWFAKTMGARRVGRGDARS